MSTWKRAFLYVIRKKVKTVLLFCVLLAMSTFILTGLSIYKATDAVSYTHLTLPTILLV